MDRYWGLIPAAGAGQRFGAPTPKQFLNLAGKLVVEWSILALANHEKIDGVCIGLAENCVQSADLPQIHSKVAGTFTGGATRAQTVLNGVNYLLNGNGDIDDWVLVHDSNRPLLSNLDISRLISSVGDDIDGGIIGLPVHDTLKLESNGRIKNTLDRSQQYRALTPQMFRLGLLHDALIQCKNRRLSVTDEAQAMEALGYHPLLVTGETSNIKITTPTDFEFAEALLTQKGNTR